MAGSGVPSTLQLYLREIQHIPVLTAKQEKDLGRKIIEEGDPEARELMIKSNLRLVVTIAKHYTNRGLTLADLVEEGNLGLLKAVENFDPTQEARFSTYAAWWIKQAIKRALMNSGQAIRVPAYMVELIAKWKQTTRQLERKLGRKPSMEEMAEVMDLPPKKLAIVRRAVQASQNPSQEMVSEDGEAVGLGGILEAENEPRPETSLFMNDEVGTLKSMLDSISEREAIILRLRFGLDGHEPLTLKEIGEHVGLTRERVRQIEAEALKKLNQMFHGDGSGRLGKLSDDKKHVSV